MTTSLTSQPVKLSGKPVILCDFESEALDSVYAFTNKPPPEEQKDEPKELLDFMRAALTFSPVSLEPTDPLSLTSDEENRSLMTGLLNQSDINSRHVMFSAYGCALIASKCSDELFKIDLVVLDGWGFAIHSQAQSDRYFFSIPEKYVVLYCGTLDSTPDAADAGEDAPFNRFLGAIKAEIQKCEKYKLDERHARENHRGHQRTGAFIFSIVRDTLAQFNEEDTEALTQPPGAITDVGLHTGGIKRNTTWPLICAIMQFHSDPILIQKLLIRFDCFVLQLARKKFSADFFSTENIDKIVTIQRSLFKKLESARKEDIFSVNIDKFFLETTELVQKLTQERYTENYVLGAESTFVVRNPTIVITLPSDEQSGASQASVEKTEQENSKWNIDISVKDLANFGRFFTQLSKTPEEKLHVLTLFEIYMFERAASLTQNVLQPADGKILNVCIVMYRNSINDLIKANAFAGSMTTIVRSRELLVVWIAYCMFFECAKTFHNIRGYGVALDPKPLEHTLFFERLAQDAALLVFKFLETNTTKSTPLFHPINDAPTLRFAEAYASADPVISAEYEFQKAAAKQKEILHWQKIKTQQNQLAIKRKTVEETQVLLGQLRDAMELVDQESNEYRNFRWRCKQLNISLNDLRKDVKNCGIPPAIVEMPLSKDSKTALGCLFFMHMPESLNLLAHFGFMAQRMLIGVSTEKDQDLDKLFQKLSIGKTVNFFETYYSSHKSKSTGHLPVIYGNLSLKYTSVSNMRKEQPDHIDSFYDSSVGLFYPDDLQFEIVWDGGKIDTKSELYNPFEPLPVNHTKRIFTESLTNKDLSAMMLFSKDDTRAANYALANQHLRPTFMSKSAFLLFGVLKTFPNLHIRKLAIALQETMLPLEDADVCTMIKQIVYQLGEIIPVRATLKSNDDLDQGGYKMICEGLQTISGPLKQTPRDKHVLPILAAIATFYAQFDRSFKPICTDLAASAIEWGESIDPSTPEGRTERAICFGYAILCFENYTLDSITGEALLFSLLSFADEYQLEESDRNAQKARLICLKNSVLRIVTAQFSKIKSLIATDPMILTRVVRKLVSFIPSDVVWSQIRFANDLSTCLRATFADVNGQLSQVLVNLITGTVLINGYPKDSLPESIRKNDSFKSFFGVTDLQVARLPDGFKTVRPIEGRSFEFRFIKKELQIVEVENRNRLVLLPLHGQEEIGRLGVFADLPNRLQTLHSHWWHQESSTLVFRDPKYNMNLVSYLAVLNGDDATVYIVPEKLQKANWMAIMEHMSIMDRLVLSTDPIMNVIGKLESPDFVHVKVDTQCQAWLNLVRFRLSFNLVGTDWHSAEFKNFKLAPCQQLGFCFPNFTEYLILQNILDPSENLLIVDDGTVSVDETGVVHVVYDSDSRKSKRYNIYRWHPRFGTVSCKTISGRLRLAALFAASGSLLRDSNLQMTGSQIALKLVRESWVNRPFSKLEEDCLENVLDFTSREPALAIACFDLMQSQQLTSFLHESEGSAHKLLNEPDWFVQSQIEYYNALPENARSRLSEIEFSSAFSTKETRVALFEIKNTNQPREDCSTILKNFQMFEDQLLNFTPAETAVLKPDFAFGDGSTVLERKIISQLQESWNEYEAVSDSGDLSALQKIALSELISNRFAVLSSEISRLEFEIQLRIKSVEREDQLRSSIDLLPIVTRADIVTFVYAPENIFKFNPKITNADAQEIVQLTFLLLQLFVQEDKINRLIATLKQKKCILDYQRILNEVRIWNVHDHPRWLAFEVSERIQIRPEQYIVAKHLIKNPGAMVQLNLGLGKTRVITPMLFMHYTDRNHIGEKLNRLILLPEIFKQAYDYFHEILTASIFNIRVYVNPFKREFGDLTKTNVARVAHMLSQAKQFGGVLIVTPPQMLSFNLRALELGIKKSDSMFQQFRKIQQFPFRDILDEADALLTHKFQLIYAVGNHAPLPDGRNRWAIVSAVLQVVSFPNEELEQLLSSPGFAVRAQVDNSFNQIRISTSSQASLMNIIIVNQLFENPPFDLKWISGFPHDAISHFVTNPEIDADLLKTLNDLDLNDNQRAQLLMLRGLLAYGILAHCLTLRHRVDYGIDPRRKKELAIPFLGNDSPSITSEFAHPDVCITLTLLAFYYEGISSAQVLQAFKKLLSLGPSAQKCYYDSWLLQVCFGLPADEYKMIDMVEKIDLSNAKQLDLLVKTFAKCYGHITFWLELCVFPVATQQFDQRIMQTAWDLVTSNSIGFSGTNDTSLLFPTHVRFEHCDSREIRSTDGNMVYFILNNATLHLISDEPKWTSVLRFILGRNISSLIDTGALMTSVSNKDIAQFIMQNCSKFEGVVYFDISKDDWIVCDRGCFHVSFNSSPISSTDCFVYFDEKRSRGADIKQNSNITAAITLGPMISKDKFMQGAGRLRERFHGQKLEIICFDEVAQAVRKSSDQFSVSSALQWIMKNTVEMIAKGLPQWAKNGFYHFNVRDKMESAQLPEMFGLDQMYCKSISCESVHANIMRAHKNVASKNPGIPTVVSIAEEYGKEFKVASSSLEEECERELVKEIEQEEEREVEYKQATIKGDIAWMWESAIIATSINSILQESKAVHVKDFLKDRVSGDLTSLNWSIAGLYLTDNFCMTIASKVGEKLNDYLRLVDMILMFPEEDKCLLLTEFEAEHLLKVFKMVHSQHCFLTNLTFLRKAKNENLAMIPLSVPPSKLQVSENLMCTLQLFAGETAFPTAARKSALQQLIKSKKSKAAVSQIQSARGLIQFFLFSDLHVATNSK